MKKNAKANYSPGDPILARDLNVASQNGNRAAVAGPGGGYGALYEDFQGTSPTLPLRVLMVRATRDILPDTYNEQTELEVDNNFNFNAIRQVWDEEKEDWHDVEGDEITIVTSYLPVLEDDIIPVYYNTASRRWAPLEQRVQEMVEVVSTTKNSDGFYDGYITDWNNEDRQWERRRLCHVLDANDPAFPTVGPEE